MGLTLTTFPSTALVSTSLMKSHLRVEISDDDTLIDGIVSAATRLAMDQLEQAFIHTTYTLTLDSWDDSDWTDSDGNIVFPVWPLSSVTTLKYYNTDNTQTTIASSNYQVDTSSVPGRLAFVADASVDSPELYDRLSPIEIVFVAGYGSASTNVPTPIIEAVKRIAANMYANREALPAFGVEMQLLNSCRHHGYK